MKHAVLAVSALLASATALQAAPLPGDASTLAPAARPARPDSSPVSNIDDLAIWSSVDFQVRFVESYLPDTEVEPNLTIPEREVMQQVLELKTNDQLEEAVALLQEERSEAASAVIDYTLGQFFQEQGEVEQAILAYEVAVEKFPKFRRAWQNLAVLRVQEGDHAHAIVAFTKVLELAGGNTYTYGGLGIAYLEQENFIAAESAFRMAILLDGTQFLWKKGLAQALFKQEQFPAAASLAGSMIKEAPDRAELWMLQANAFLGMQQPLRAAENFEFVDALGGSTPESLSLLGDIYVNQELYDLAAPAYQRSFEMDPVSRVDAAVNHARILSVRGQLDHTGVLVGRIEELAGERLDESQRTALLKLEVRIASADGASEEEARILKQIVDINPLDGDALIMLGDHSRSLGDVEQAIFYYERAASLEEFEARAKREHASLLVAELRYAEALPLLKRSYDLDPRESVATFIEHVERAAAQNR